MAITETVRILLATPTKPVKNSMRWVRFLFVQVAQEPKLLGQIRRFLSNLQHMGELRIHASYICESPLRD